MALPITVDRDRGVPLHRQIAEQLTELVERGVLGAGTRLPSTRALAASFGVSRGVAVAAYDLLFAAGVLRGRRGAGSYVQGLPSVRRTTGPMHGMPPPIDLRPGQSNLTRFPREAWRAAWRAAGHVLPRPAPPLGLPRLRAALTDYLERNRGLAMANHEVIVTGGPSHSAELLVRAVCKADDIVAVEDPAPWPLRAFVGALGPMVRPVPVWPDGLWLDLPSKARLVFTSPDGHDPLGTRMPLWRRRALLDWSRAADSVLVELGQEVPEHHEPVPSLLQLGDRASVVHIGSLRSLFGSALPLGYLVVPRRFVPRLEVVLTETVARPAPVPQEAAAELLQRGAVQRYRTRLTELHALRLAAVRSGLEDLPVEVRGSISAGTATVLLPQGVTAGAVLERLRPKLVVDPIVFNGGEGLVLGCAHLDEGTLRTAISLLGKAIADVPPMLSRAG
ncbi:PLP-dependent aminotransferase family protein [Allokutzneria sp. A3M-2-11 16]|uniref:aminotransferase-like domain-containing protein n=1 Tax=Allokutzneria sp. A3M-2-11 16 TaxID=2962043 RepID=UPI0020B7EADE|nr:PLP-dependent aminotransferase family protein [Allokutzneria sp. A3M-2-11 16]MCP3802742.1 PLP-dependent aminotransferase family protein [Allokutzneria sp. A3M-2-11 16]